MSDMGFSSDEEEQRAPKQRVNIEPAKKSTALRKNKVDAEKKVPSL